MTFDTSTENLNRYSRSALLAAIKENLPELAPRQGLKKYLVKKYFNQNPQSDLEKFAFDLHHCSRRLSKKENVVKLYQLLQLSNLEGIEVSKETQRVEAAQAAKASRPTKIKVMFMFFKVLVGDNYNSIVALNELQGHFNQPKKLVTIPQWGNITKFFIDLQLTVGQTIEECYELAGIQPEAAGPIWVSLENHILGNEALADTLALHVQSGFNWESLQTWKLVRDTLKRFKES